MAERKSLYLSQGFDMMKNYTMVSKLQIDNLHCLCARSDAGARIAYILYPMDMLTDWIEPAAERYDTDIVVITGMDWQNVMSPWPAKGVPRGCPDFEGGAPEFLSLLQDRVIPAVEKELGYAGTPPRSLVGVSMSGLFALWQWMLCDTFASIASLSGSFWYEGFADWMKSRAIPAKQGMAYFLLGEQEPKSRVKAFDTVGVNTQEIIALLRDKGIATKFESVPGNHYANPLPRLDKALTALSAAARPTPTARRR